MKIHFPKISEQAPLNSTTCSTLQICKLHSTQLVKQLPPVIRSLYFDVFSNFSIITAHNIHSLSVTNASY